MQSVFIFVLTGGPCSGKTTALAYLREKLESRGYHVLVVPETATALMSSGYHPRHGSDTFQEHLFDLQMHLERGAFAYANFLADTTDKSVVVICDRGLCDIKVYTDPTHFLSLCKVHDVDPVAVRDVRYTTGVIHLETAAIDAEWAYTNANNPHRLENKEEARQKDTSTRNAWVGTPHFRVIKNKDKSFEQKLRATLAEMLYLMGVPHHVEHESKMIVRLVGPLPEAHVRANITQYYAVAPDPENVEVRYRMRECGNYFSFYRTVKRKMSSSENAIIRVETEDIISEREYVSSLATQDPKTDIIRKTRTTFLVGETYFELDQFPPHVKQLAKGELLLEVEHGVEYSNIELPSFLEFVRDAPDLTNRSIAMRT